MTNKLMEVALKNNIRNLNVGIEPIEKGIKITGFLSDIQNAVETIKSLAPENMNIYIEHGTAGFEVFYEIVKR